MPQPRPRFLYDIARDLLELEYPIPSSERLHPDPAGTRLWAELRQFFVLKPLKDKDEETEPVPEYFAHMKGHD